MIDVSNKNGLAADPTLKAISAAMDMTFASLGKAVDRDPTPDDIPRDPEPTIINRLDRVVEMLDMLQGQADMAGNCHVACAIEMTTEKLDAIICDIALAEAEEGKEQ